MALGSKPSPSNLQSPVPRKAKHEETGKEGFRAFRGGGCFLFFVVAQLLADFNALSLQVLSIINSGQCSVVQARDLLFRDSLCHCVTSTLAGNGREH